MLDLTNAKELPNGYGGSEAKKTILYNDKIYMLKFPDPVRGSKIKELNYINNQFSEDIGCKIFQSIGIRTQNTFLAKYTEKSGREKIVVACEDFCLPNNATLKEFKNLALAVTDSNQISTVSFEFINDVLNKSDVIANKEAFKNQFWNMFVVDALIGNRDRHLGNFGLLVSDESSSFSPIYDCGSALSPLMSDNDMIKIINNEGEFSSQEYNIASVFKYKGKRVFYHEIFKNPPKELADAICRVMPKIDINKISTIIHNTEGISDIRKEYLLKSIAVRYNKILKSAYKKLQNMQSVKLNLSR